MPVSGQLAFTSPQIYFEQWVYYFDLKHRLAKLSCCQLPLPSHLTLSLPLASWPKNSVMSDAHISQITYPDTKSREEKRLLFSGLKDLRPYLESFMRGSRLGKFLPRRHSS